MKHIFFAFPAGRAGVALLVLRGSVVVFMIAAPFEFAPPFWVAIPAYIGAFALALGFATRVAAGLCVALCAFLVWPMGAPPIPLLAQGLAAAALAMIGPGAFSIDANLFGRRTIHLPD